MEIESSANKKAVLGWQFEETSKCTMCSKNLTLGYFVNLTTGTIGPLLDPIISVRRIQKKFAGHFIEMS